MTGVQTCALPILTTEDLKTAQKNIKSISSTLEKRIKEIKEAVKDMDLKPASNPENKMAAKPTLKKKTADREDNAAITARVLAGFGGKEKVFNGKTTRIF